MHCLIYTIFYNKSRIHCLLRQYSVQKLHHLLSYIARKAEKCSGECDFQCHLWFGYNIYDGSASIENWHKAFHLLHESLKVSLVEDSNCTVKNWSTVSNWLEFIIIAIFTKNNFAENRHNPFTQTSDNSTRFGSSRRT